MAIGGLVPESSVSYAMVADGVPYPVNEGSSTLPLKVLPPFPKGITSVAMWGRTVIDFGMFKSQRITYEDLVTADDKQKVDYIKWCRARCGSATGHLKDFCDFLRHYFQYEIGDSGLMIPCTGHARILKP